MTGLAWLACHYRHDWGGLAGLAVLVGLSVSAGLEALHVTDGHLADVLGLAAAIGVVVYGYGLTLIPLATAIGLATHVVGDMLTDSGVRLLYPFSVVQVPPAARAAGVHHRHPAGDQDRRPGPVRRVRPAGAVGGQPGPRPPPVPARGRLGAGVSLATRTGPVPVVPLEPICR